MIVNLKIGPDPDKPSRIRYLKWLNLVVGLKRGMILLPDSNIREMKASRRMML